MRKFVALALAVATSVLVSASGLEAPSAQTASPKPNILFVETDDQPASTLRYMSNVTRRMQGKGIYFRNAWNVYTLCCPSRAVVQRGQYAHNTGVFGNGPSSDGGYEEFDRLDHELSTYVTWLHNAGYYTGHFGKYMNGYENLDIDGDPHTPAGWDVFDQAGATTPGDTAYIQSGPFAGELRDSVAASASMDFLRRRAPLEQPFLLQVDFFGPHVPNAWESRYDGMFAGERVPRGKGYNEANVSDKPRYIREDKPALQEQYNPQVDPPCRDDEQNSVQQNDCQWPRILRSLQTVDAFVGEALDYLASEGELKNTYIVYYTDNGNHWGEHRLDYGKLTPYSMDANFPILMRGPGISQGVISDRLVGNHDLAPTFAAIGGAAVPEYVDGRSFLGLAKGDATNWSRTAIYGERRTNYDKLPSKSHAQYVPAYEVVREQHVMYVRYRDDRWTAKYDPGFREYYDLRNDPNQLHNLVVEGGVSQATLERLQNRLVQLRGCRADGCRAAENGP